MNRMHFFVELIPALAMWIRQPSQSAVSCTTPFTFGCSIPLAACCGVLAFPSLFLLHEHKKIFIYVLGYVTLQQVGEVSLAYAKISE